MTIDEDAVRKLWDERADRGDYAGANDLPLRWLEQRAFLSRIPVGSRVLDVGCGTADTLIRLAKENQCTGVGIDYSGPMIAAAARNIAAANVTGAIRVAQGDVRTFQTDEPFDWIISQRCLINLPTAETQRAAFENIATRCGHAGSTYLMIEAFTDGNDALNAVRVPLGLPPMVAPWHNLYLDLRAVRAWGGARAMCDEVNHFASTYYFVSRILYAQLCAERGDEMRYDSELNKLSLRLPPVGAYGATKLMRWRLT